MIVTLTLNPSLDRTFVTDRLDHGEVNRMTDTWDEAAGKGVNVTRALVANGVDSIAVTPVGGANGQALAGLLEAAHIPFVPVPISEPIRANVSVVEADGTVTKLNEPGPTLSDVELSNLTQAALTVTTPDGWLVACGSLPPGVPVEVYGTITREAQATGVRVAVDTSGASLEACLVHCPTLIKPNHEELAELVGAPLPTLGDVIRAARSLIERGIDEVLVSLGPDGAVLVRSDGATHGISAVDSVANTVGAGDALLAGYLAGGTDAAVALANALAFGSAAVRSPGTAIGAIGDTDRASVRLFDAVDESLQLS